MLHLVIASSDKSKLEPTKAASALKQCEAERVFCTLCHFRALGGNVTEAVAELLIAVFATFSQQHFGI